jgi:predicted alpha-1,2-mannosidase
MTSPPDFLGLFRTKRRRAALLLFLLTGALILLLVGTALESSLNTSTSSSSLLRGGASTSSTRATSGLSYTVGDALPTNSSTVGNLTRFVNPFIGTENIYPMSGGGDTFPGADYPMGMVQWSPDTISNPPGGYSYTDSIIKGLSLTHFSGRGCQVYQDFPFMPYVGNVTVSPATNDSVYQSSFSHSSEAARPGYYRVHLEGPNVTAELSATLHTGMGRFVYPASNDSTMIINAGGSINGDTNSGISIIPSEDEVTGSAESTVGCGSNPYLIFFAARFDRSFSSYGTWNGASVDHGSASTARGGQHTGAFVTFNTSADQVVDVQVGISFVSVANAELNLSTEFANFNLESVAKAASIAWNDRLNSIQVQGGTYNDTVAFYTALYHVFFHPNIFNDVNGQYLGFDGLVHTVPSGHIQYENINGWDDYRTQIRLLAILAPATTSDIAQSLINDAQQSGSVLPRWEQANADSHGMSGDSGDAIVADAYAFGATGFDTSAALNSMIAGQPHQREGFTDYVGLGYVPADSGATPYSASVTLEYANDDFALAEFARALGNSTVYSTYLQRSGDWANIFDNASGYIQPRDANGSWAQGFRPASNDGFEEGNSAQYSWMVTYNLAGLFGRMGGNSAVVARLENFTSQMNAGPGAPYLWMGNEPSVEVPWEFDFAQAPSQTQKLVRQIETLYWTNTPGGLLGNDDGGEMSSWYVFATIGLYPEITGVGGFVVGSPLFTSVTVNLAAAAPGGGEQHSLQIEAPGGSDSTPYVQSLTIDGSPSSSLWIPWSTLQNGATLDFTLSGSPSSWGSSPQDAPPSYPSSLS